MGISTVNSMNWVVLRMMLIEDYYARDEVQNLEHGLWNLTMKGSVINAYTTGFNDLATICPGHLTLEYKKYKRYISGLAPQIQGMLIASKPIAYDNRKRIAYHLTNMEI